MEDLNNEKKQGLIKSFSEINKIHLIYYILSFVVLFFKIFTLETDNLTGSTYRIGLFEFAQGIGWFYYLINAIGVVIVVVRLLNFLDNLAVKIFSVANLIISSMLLLKTIPDAIRPSGSIVSIIGKGELAIGFWLILGLHTLAIVIFYFKFIRAIKKKNKVVNEENIIEEISEIAESEEVL